MSGMYLASLEVKTRLIETVAFSLFYSYRASNRKLTLATVISMASSMYRSYISKGILYPRLYGTILLTRGRSMEFY